MGKKRGHGGHHRHGGHHDFFHPGMGPMNRMHGPPGHHGEHRGPPFDPMGDFPPPRGPPMDPRGFGMNSRMGGPPNDIRGQIGGFGDTRFGCPGMGGMAGMRHQFYRNMFGRHNKFVSSSSSSSSSSSDSSSSDSDTKGKKKKYEKKGKRRCVKHWHLMHQMMSDPNWNKVQCTLCWRQIRPLAETDVLECGHIYHRSCLKELFAVSKGGEQTEVFCTQCRQQIDTDLATELQNRFNSGPTTTDPQSSSKEDMTRDFVNLKVK